MKGIIIVGLIMALVFFVFSYTCIELYRIEMDSYDARMIAFYDSIFAYQLEKGLHNDSFNYTPFNPEKDLSEVVM